MFLLSLPRPALAQDAAADEEAHAVFNAAQVAYNQGEFQRALDYFERSYELSARPALLYNIATTQDRLRMDREALASYRRYLELDPEGAQIQLARNRIRDLETRVTDEPQEVDQVVVESSEEDFESREERAVTEPVEHDDQGPNLLPAIITLSVGGALVLASIGTLIWWVGADSKVGDCNTVGCTNGPELAGERDAAAGVTITLGVIGLAAVATGAVLLVTAGGGSDDEAGASLSCLPSPFGIACAGRF
jgi:tetratricopeptide (TPR) repeat protein